MFRLHGRRSGVVWRQSGAAIVSATLAPRDNHRGIVSRGHRVLFAAGLLTAGGLTFSYTPTGGLSFAGAASSARGVIRAVAGGLLIAGTSAMSTVNSLVVMPVGGMLIAGTAATVRTCTRLVAGGLTLAGHAVAEFGNIYAAVADWVGFIRRGGRR